MDIQVRLIDIVVGTNVYISNYPRAERDPMRPIHFIGAENWEEIKGDTCWNMHYNSRFGPEEHRPICSVCRVECEHIRRVVSKDRVSESRDEDEDQWRRGRRR